MWIILLSFKSQATSLFSLAQDGYKRQVPDLSLGSQYKIK